MAPHLVVISAKLYRNHIYIYIYLGSKKTRLFCKCSLQPTQWYQRTWDSWIPCLICAATGCHCRPTIGLMIHSISRSFEAAIDVVMWWYHHLESQQNASALETECVVGLICSSSVWSTNRLHKARKMSKNRFTWLIATTSMNNPMYIHSWEKTKDPFHQYCLRVFKTTTYNNPTKQVL